MTVLGVLLEQARKVFGGGPQELPAVEPIEMPCACGQGLRGVRRDERQFLRCDRCGQTAFILPISAYPAPEPIGAAAAARAPVVAAPRRVRPLGVRLRIRARRSRRRVRAGLRRLVPPARWFSPGRMLTLGMLLLIGGTTALTVYLNQRSDLASEIPAARASWTAALETEDPEGFAVARRELDRAAALLRRYDSGNPERREIEQLAREVGLFADLLKPSLGELIGMDARQRAELTGAGFVLDAFVIPATTDATPDNYRLASPIVLELDGRTARIAADISDLSLLARFAPRQPTRMLFGARLLSVQPAEGAGSRWVIRFAPDSGVLVTSESCLKKAGWPVDDALRAHLETQQKWLSDQP